MDKDRIIEMALIGDGYVGKTSILNCLQKTSYDKATSPNIYDEALLEKQVNERKITFRIMDTAGQDEYDQIRIKAYEKADVFLLCFCVADKVSYENITSKWIPDLQHYRNKPIILIGTKMDLRKGSSNINISVERGIRLQKRIGAKFYVECSSKHEQGISSIIDAASRALSTSQEKKNCVVQ